MHAKLTTAFTVAVLAFISVILVDGGFRVVEFVETTEPTQPESGRVHIYADSTSHAIKVSASGTFATLLTTATGATLSGGLVPMSQLATGTPTGAKFIRDDGTLQAIPGALSDGDKGDVTVSNNAATWTIDNGAVTYAKMQDVSATDKLLGRSTAGGGDVEEISCTSAGRALLDDVDATAQRTTLGLGTLATQNGTCSGVNTGDQTSVSGNAGTATALQNARTINGVSFDGTANITVAASGATLTGVAIAAGMLGVTATTAAAGNDARLSDDRTASGLRSATTIVSVSGATAPSSGQVLTATGTTGATWQSPTITVLRTASNQTITATGFADVTGLTFAVVANTSYAFKCHITFRSAQTATGQRFAMNGPANSTVDFFMTYQTVINTSTSGVATWLQGHWITYDAMTVTTASPVANEDMVTIIDGRVLVGATPGTMAVRAASETANNDMTVRQGSWCWFF